MTNISDELSVRPFEFADEEAVVDLWHRCGLVVPWNDPHEDIATKMGFQPDLFLVGTLEGRVVATAMAGYEGHRGWINYLGVAPGLRRRGIGRRIMEEAEARLRELGRRAHRLPSARWLPRSGADSGGAGQSRWLREHLG